MKKDLYDISIGLVLAGGGAKGAYEVGVYKALKELEIVDNIKVISGTSIGSINALFFAMNDLKIIESSWNSLKYSQFLFLHENYSVLEKIKNNNTDNNLLEKIRFCDIGLLSQEGIRNFIEEYIDMKAVKKSGKEIYVNAYNVDKERPEYFKLNDFNEEEIKERVLASCAVPHLFKPMIIEGIRYADGGINSPLYSKNNVDNVPIYPMKNHECDIIIVVHLSYKNNIDRNGFENSRIIEIYPSTPLEIINGIGTINIKKDTIEHNIELGYRDAMVIIAPMIINILKGRSIEDLVEKNDENNKKYRD